jgi:hypothetical protein
MTACTGTQLAMPRPFEPRHILLLLGFAQSDFRGQPVGPTGTPGRTRSAMPNHV